MLVVTENGEERNLAKRYSDFEAVHTGACDLLAGLLLVTVFVTFEVRVWADFLVAFGVCRARR